MLLQGQAFNYTDLAHSDLETNLMARSLATCTYEARQKSFHSVFCLRFDGSRLLLIHQIFVKSEGEERDACGEDGANSCDSSRLGGSGAGGCLGRGDTVVRVASGRIVAGQVHGLALELRVLAEAATLEVIVRRPQSLIRRRGARAPVGRDLGSPNVDRRVCARGTGRDETCGERDLGGVEGDGWGRDHPVAEGADGHCRVNRDEVIQLGVGRDLARSHHVGVAGIVVARVVGQAPAGR